MDARDKNGRWKPGFQPAGAGKPKGTRNKFTEDFLRDFHKAWQEGGVEALKQVSQNDPSTFVRVAASILPKHVEHRHSIIDELQQLPIEEMRRRLAEIRADREQPSH